jgi:acetyl-CoA acetyltransferase
VSRAVIRPAFRDGGTVNTGNSSGINDGAAAVVVASEEKARALGIEPLLHELRRRGGRYGQATMCVGVGQGQAALCESR